MFYVRIIYKEYKTVIQFWWNTDLRQEIEYDIDTAFSLKSLNEINDWIRR